MAAAPLVLLEAVPCSDIFFWRSTRRLMIVPERFKLLACQQLDGFDQLVVPGQEQVSNVNVLRC
jgi:hypothetical protein